MRRRYFLQGLGCVAVMTASRGAQAQRRTPVIGFLNGQSASELPHAVAAFQEGLNGMGYVDGRNVAIEYRWAEGRPEKLAALAADLAQRKVDVIASTGGDPVALAVKKARASVPAVFVIGGDPVALGLVASLNRPGGNITGVTQITVELDPKRLEVLHELMPGVSEVAVLRNHTNANADAQLAALQSAAGAMKIKLRAVTASNEREIDSAFAQLKQPQVKALMVASDPFFNARRNRIVALATQLAVPVVFHQREFALDGGLMSYGTSVTDAYRRNAIYVARILKGERPAELPVQQSTKVELIVNLKAAKSLGVTVPQTLLARADEIIE